MTKNNQEWSDKVKLLKTVPGIGPVISSTIVSDLPELGKLSAKCISKLVGVAPLNHDSGQFKGTCAKIKYQLIRNYSNIPFG